MGVMKPLHDVLLHTDGVMNDIIKTLLSHPRDKPLSDGLLAGVLQALVSESQRAEFEARAKASPPPKPAPKQSPNVAMSTMDDDQTIGTEQLAIILNKSTSTVEKMRRETGKGPKFIPGGKARYRVGDVRDWIKSHTVANTTEATVKGLSHFILEGTTSFPVFLYGDGSILGINAAIQYELDNPETTCEAFAVVNMGNAWETHKELYDGLLNNPEAASAILSDQSIASNFDVAYWLFVQFIGGRVDSYQPLLKAIQLLVERGTDINAQNNMTGYNIAHVLAINEQGFINENDFYNFMIALLDMGIDVDLMNHENISGRDIAEQNDSSPSTSNFMKVLNRRDFASSLEAKLKKK